jgi:hypothetical protein
MSLPCSSGLGSESMSWSVEFIPLVPWPVLWIIAAIGAALLVLLFWRARRGAVLRLLAFAMLLLAIANPHLKREDREALNDIVAVVVDDSQSQTIARRTERTEDVRKDLEEQLKAIPNLDTRFVRSLSTSADNERDGTMLFTDLGQALADVPPDRLAGVIMITEGEVHDVPGTAKALGFDAPVHALLTGKEGEFDRRLEVLSAPRFGIVGSLQPIEVKVTETKPGDAGTATLTITHQGQAPTQQTVRIGETIEVPVEIDHAGPNIVEIAAEAAPGELTTINNRTVLTVEGVRENLRVLLVSGEPHAGERTWRNLLKSDASVDLVHFTILRPPEKQDGTPINQLSLIAFPTRELFQEKLDEFDLIIFDRYQRRGVLPLLYLENVARYVERGGAVLVSAGDDYASALSLYRTPLGQILPAVPSGRVIEEPYKPALTDLGGKHPVTSDLPGAGVDGAEPTWGRWFRVVDVSPQDGEVLMNGADDRPLLVIGERGKGRVALLLSDHAWLWARGYDGGGPYTDLLRRLAHWLMKEPELEEETLKATSRGQTLVIERRSINDEVDPVTVTAPSGKEETVTLDKGERGLWRKTMTVEEQGVFSIASGKLASIVTVGRANTRELAAVTATDAPLAPLLEETGGGAFWLGREEGEAAGLPRLVMMRSGHVMHGADWLGLHKRDAYHVKGVRLFPLFTGFLALALLLGLLAATWYREGH